MDVTDTTRHKDPSPPNLHRFSPAKIVRKLYVTTTYIFEPDVQVALIIFIFGDILKLFDAALEQGTYVTPSLRHVLLRPKNVPVQWRYSYIFRTTCLAS